MSEYRWYRAASYLDFLFVLRDNTYEKFDPKNYEDLIPLKRRLDGGERSVELYEEIMTMC